MENKYITVAYKLYAVLDGKKELLEEAPASNPFQFISGLGYTLDKFEKEISPLSPGASFSFTIPCKEAYGERLEENVRQLPKTMFNNPEGHFDAENIFTGNTIMLQDNEGNRFYANVGEITDTAVTIDLNHPHAGKDLIFEGHVVESRPATAEEIAELKEAMNGGGCNCGDGCNGCEGGCDCNDEGHEGACCGGGHCH